MTEVESKPTVDWDPRTPDALENQQAVADQMRERCPVAYSDYFQWSLFKHEDIVAICRDPETFSNGFSTLEQIEAEEQAGRNVGIPLVLDPPVHTRYRSMMTPYFSMPRMKAFEPRSREIAVRLLEPLLQAGMGDAVEIYADPYPVQSLCALIGWNADDWRQIKQWTTDSERGVVRRDQALLDRVHGEWNAYILAVVQQRRMQPQEDITSWLLQQDKKETPLNDAKLTSILQLLLHAGHGTTAASIGICIYHLARDRLLQDRLRADPSAIPRAVEEILRWDGPLVAMRRIAKKDVEIRNRKIRAGEVIQMMYLAADRDPDVFPNADQLDIDRKPNRHLIWGTGIHTCLGMLLAKLELRVALEELLARTRGFHLEPGAQIRRLRYPGNSPRTLPLVIE